jgi:hypothetical protein
LVLVYTCAIHAAQGSLAQSENQRKNWKSAAVCTSPPRSYFRNSFSKHGLLRGLAPPALPLAGRPPHLQPSPTLRPQHGRNAGPARLAPVSPRKSTVHVAVRENRSCSLVQCPSLAPRPPSPPTSHSPAESYAFSFACSPISCRPSVCQQLINVLSTVDNLPDPLRGGGCGVCRSPSLGGIFPSTGRTSCGANSAFR